MTLEKTERTSHIESANRKGNFVRQKAAREGGRHRRENKIRERGECQRMRTARKEKHT